MTAPFELASNGRAAAESLMSSTCTIRARPGAPTTDPTTGEVTATPGSVLYAGKCRVRPSGGNGTVLAGGAELFTFDYLISVPYAVSSVTEGCRVTVDTSPDPALAGVEVQVQKVDRGEHISARRLYCGEVS